MRILMVVDSLQVAGGERHAVDLACALVERGHTVAVACASGGALQHVLARNYIPVHVLLDRAVKRRVSVRFALQLRQVLDDHHMDLVHAHMYASAAAGALAVAGRAVPFVTTEHSQAGWRGAVNRQVSRSVLGRAGACIAVSSGIRQRLIQVDRVQASRVFTIANTVLPAVHGGKFPAGLVHGEHSLVGVVARLQPEKGVGVFLEAAVHIQRVRPDCRFVIVGDGPLRERLERRAHELDLCDRTQFLGFREDATAIMSLLDVLVVPSLSEGTPLVVLEAMMAGIPIVASCVGGIPQQIRHCHEGLLVPSRDPHALAQACLALLNAPGLAQRLALEAQQRSIQEFDHGTMVDRIEGVYHRVLGAHRDSSANPLNRS